MDHAARLTALYDAALRRARHIQQIQQRYQAALDAAQKQEDVKQ